MEDKRRLAARTTESLSERSLITAKMSGCLLVAH
jgi:hypothetical protein